MQTLWVSIYAVLEAHGIEQLFVAGLVTLLTLRVANIGTVRETISRVLIPAISSYYVP